MTPHMFWRQNRELEEFARAFVPELVDKTYRARSNVLTSMSDVRVAVHGWSGVTCADVDVDVGGHVLARLHVVANRFASVTLLTSSHTDRLFAALLCGVAMLPDSKLTEWIFDRSSRLFMFSRGMTLPSCAELLVACRNARCFQFRGFRSHQLNDAELQLNKYECVA